VVSRRARVVVIVALFGWAISGVPDRVRTQRDAVAELAAERGAASAGGALLGRIADLPTHAALDAADVWRIDATTPCAAPVPASPRYADVVAALRGQRACAAARTLTGGATAARLVEVDGDPFLVVPERPPAQDRLAEGPAATVAPADVTGTAEAPAVVAPTPVGAPELDEGDLLALHALHALHLLGPHEIGEILAGVPTTATVGTTTSIPVTVAWWPPIQAEIEARTGIPLQVGGEPPHARAILPGHRLTGVPVWSLPTPATEATVDLFDGGTLLWLLLLAALLAREGLSWRRAAALEAERQTTRDAILQRISHELRTPAAAVRSLVDALAIPGTSESEREQFRELARGEAERLASGIDRFLQAARGATDTAADPVPLDLSGWAEAVRARWATRLPHLVVQAAHPSPAVADPERLDEAVDALLDNAVKYGGPNVTLTVGPNQVAVEDDGEGIPVKDRARLLHKFERQEGRVNDPGGHGLGLWAVAEVARAHGGRLVVEAKSRFVLVLGGGR